MNAAAYGETAETFYGEMGKYARIINPPDASGRSQAGKVEAKPENPSFRELKLLDITLAAGTRWATAADFAEPERANLRAIRQRFGVSMAVADFNGDGKLDIYACSAMITQKGLRDVLLMNLGGGRFVDESEKWGVPTDFSSTGVALADFDADRQMDILLTGQRENRLMRNTGGWLD
ncbi:MAG: FG-GAP repeat domain-containing protein, partial [bacterium]